LSKSDKNGLKGEIQDFLRDRGAFKVRVANPSKGFEKTMKGCHPLDVMSQCRSVIVFAVYIGLEYYRTILIEGKTQGDNRIGHIFRDWLSHGLAAFLRTRGFNALVPIGFFDEDQKVACLSYKLAAFEAGIGVYGKSGVIITPEYGPRVNLGVVLTDAILEPDRRLDYDPCHNCKICSKVCSVNAVREDLGAPTSHDRAKCVEFIDRLREETNDENLLCGYCYKYCPVGKPNKKGFLISKNKTLEDFGKTLRERLIRKAIPAATVT
jgi:epoxyqueuosine reductase